MGSSSFEETIYGVDDLRSAYRQLCDECRYDYGASSTNGTISTTNGVRPSPLNGDKPLREDRIDWDAVEKRMTGLSKWEHCEAIRVEKVIPEQTAYIGFTDLEVSVPSDTPSEEIRTALRLSANKKLAASIRAGDTLELSNYGKVGVETIQPSKGQVYSVAMINRAQSLSKPKVTTKSTEGKAETRHFIISPTLPILPPWGEGYKTQAEARAALPKTQAEARAALPDTHDASRGEVSQWEIISITRREDGSPLVTHEVDLRGSTKNTKYLVTVGVQELVSPAKPTGEYGWLFYGIAAE